MVRSRFGLVRWTATIAIVAVLGFYLYRQHSALALLTNLEATDVGLITLNLFLVVVATGWAFKQLVETLSVRLALVEWLGLTILGSSVNYFLPGRPGLMLKATYLKRLRVPLSQVPALVLVNAILQVLVAGPLAALAILRPGLISLEQGLLLSIAAVMTIGAFLALVFPLAGWTPKGRVGAIANLAIEGFNRVRGTRWRLSRACAAVTVQLLLSAACYWATFRALDLRIDWRGALLIVSFVTLANVFAITPSNLGIQEVIVAWVYQSLGMEFGSGLLVAGVIRMLHIAQTALLTPAFSHALMGVAKRAQPPTETPRA